MDKRFLGRTDIEIAPLVLGGNVFGWTAAEYLDARGMKILAALDEVSARHGATPAQVALAWVLAQGRHVVPVPGAKRERWAAENARAEVLRLTSEDLAEVAELPRARGSWD